MKVLSESREVITGGYTVIVGHLEGTSKDKKPTDRYWDGSTFAETDTGDVYTLKNGAWEKPTPALEPVPKPAKKPTRKKGKNGT